MTDIQMKLCTRCSEIKSVSQFYNNRSAEDGLSFYCKACSNEHKRNWEEKNRDKVNQYVRNWRENNKDKVNQYSRNWRMKDYLKRLRLIQSQF